ncbi:MAG: hypothetical protein PHD97_05275 [Bacteroidales bacterium]|nr:hypothetical protein [Bacteroidales bacterium]
METNQTTDTQNESGEKNKGAGKSSTVIILSLLVILLGGTVVYLLFQKKSQKIQYQVILKEKEASSNEKVTLQRALDSLVNEHNKIKSQYGELNDRLSKKDSIIQKNVREIQNLLATTGELKRAKRKLELLRGITQGYVHQMDSLYKVNIQLTEENKQVKSDFQKEKAKTEELTVKITSASGLAAYKVKGSGVRVKGKKEEIINKAKRAEQLKVSFTILQNPLASSGSKDIYIRITGPDNKVLCDGTEDEFMFAYKNDKIVYTIKKQINYENKNLELDLYWPKKGELTPGTYGIDVFASGEQIGVGSFKLE